MSFKRFYLSIIRNFRYEIQRLLLIQVIIIFFIFLIVYINGMNSIDFLNFLFMPDSRDTILIGLYTSFIAVIILIVFRCVEITDIIKLKEFTLRINNVYKTHKALLISIIISTALYLLVLFIICIALSMILKNTGLNFGKIITVYILYTLFFIFIGLFYYYTNIHYLSKNIAYILFLLLHVNNIFLVVPYLSITGFLINFRLTSCIITASIYAAASILLYELSLKKEKISKGVIR